MCLCAHTCCQRMCIYFVLVVSVYQDDCLHLYSYGYACVFTLVSAYVYIHACICECGNVLLVST